MMAIAIRFLTSKAGGYAILAFVVVVGLGWSHMKAYNGGWNANEARHAAATRELNEKRAASDERARVLEAHNRRLAAERAELERSIADEAARDPKRDDPGLGADSLRRLDAIR